MIKYVLELITIPQITIPIFEFSEAFWYLLYRFCILVSLVKLVISLDLAQKCPKNLYKGKHVGTADEASLFIFLIR